MQFQSQNVLKLKYLDLLHQNKFSAKTSHQNVSKLSEKQNKNSRVAWTKFLAVFVVFETDIAPMWEFHAKWVILVLNMTNHTVTVTISHGRVFFLRKTVFCELFYSLLSVFEVCEASRVAVSWKRGFPSRNFKYMKSDIFVDFSCSYCKFRLRVHFSNIVYK